MTSFPALSDPAYRIESELGFGGGGVVYKAWHTRLQKYVVIKELKKGSANDIETQRNEVEALKNVKSIYLPQVYDFLTEGDHIFTVIEFIEGDSLDRLLERGQKFTQLQVIKWYGQLVSALESIHNHNVCHRDVKPANIMLTPDGDVCLIDFNAALVSGNDVRLISRSLGYASPEQYEIYERFKNTHRAMVHLGNSSVHEKIPDLTETDLLFDDDKTELVDDDSHHIGLLTQDDSSQKTEPLIAQPKDSIDWKRSDIFSLGAAMYHLLTGVRPPERAEEVIALATLRYFSEGLTFIIDRSMKIEPSERFATASVLNDAVHNIYKYDRRWKASQAKRIAVAVILPVFFTLFTVTALFGRSVMAQEKEERYYMELYHIENSAKPQEAYESALAMFWDRIDPYLAMARRFWNDGDIAVCQGYINQILGDIAKFQVVPDAMRSFGDIYYLLGNCYYQSSEPNYDMARRCFEIAIQYVVDNPIYYCDYAIALARTGNTTEAEIILEKAESVSLETDLLNLLTGEILFSKQDYDKAVDALRTVIVITNDDYIRYRAYHTTDEIFKLLGRPEDSVAILSGALNRIPVNRVPEMTERLADAYVKSGDNNSAIALFEELSERGAPQFHIMQSLAILLQNAGEFERATTILNHMTDIFPNDFRVPMRQAYLEADKQSKITNENRDYTQTKRYYDSAVGLYTESVSEGKSDPEMQQLNLLIEQLRVNKWID